MRNLFISLAAGLALTGPAIALADEFTCGERIIEAGMMLDEVRRLCGNPTDESADRWVYDRGPDKLTVIVHVQADGTVGDIEEESADDD